MKRKCSQCGIIKPIEDFHFKNKDKNDRHHNCKKCQKDNAHNHYINNKEKYKNSALNSKANTIKWWHKFKSNLKCEECGFNHPGALDFHHLEPGEKEFGVAEMIHRNNKTDALKEIEKCIVLCANCHRIKHYEEKMAKYPMLE